MIPAPPQTIKQSLNKAYRLIKPKRAHMEAFKGNLIHGLTGIDEKESEGSVKNLLNFFQMAKQANPQADTTAHEKQIDELVY